MEMEGIIQQAPQSGRHFMGLAPFGEGVFSVALFRGYTGYFYAWGWVGTFMSIMGMGRLHGYPAGQID